MSQQERSAEHLKAPFNATLIVPLPDRLAAIPRPPTSLRPWHRPLPCVGRP